MNAVNVMKRTLTKPVSELARMKGSLSELVLCSEKEMTSCSLQVLSPTGSPGRFLLAMLVDRSCPLGFLLHCLKKMDHQDAVQYLTTTGTHTHTLTCSEVFFLGPWPTAMTVMWDRTTSDVTNFPIGMDRKRSRTSETEVSDGPILSLPRSS